MDITALTLAVLSAIAPYAKSAAEAAATELGKKAGDLVQALRERWHGKESEKKALDGYLADPVGGRDRLNIALAVQLSQDDELRSKIEALLAGPRVHVQLTTENTKKATGMKVRVMLEGTAEIKMESKGGEEAVGLVADVLGKGDGPRHASVNSVPARDRGTAARMDGDRSDD
jgi:hypothetical protein